MQLLTLAKDVTKTSYIFHSTKIYLVLGIVLAARVFSGKQKCLCFHGTNILDEMGVYNKQICRVLSSGRKPNRVSRMGWGWVTTFA